MRCTQMSSTALTKVSCTSAETGTDLLVVSDGTCTGISAGSIKLADGADTRTRKQLWFSGDPSFIWRM